MKHQKMASAQDYWHQHGCIYTAQLKGASEHQGFFLTKWSWLVTLPPFLESKRRPIGRGPTTHPSYYPSWRLSHPFEKYACQILDRFSGIGVKHQKQNLKPPPSCAFFSIGFHVTSAGLKSHHAEESHITQWNCEMEGSHITRREVTSFCDNPNGTAAFNRKPKSNQI